LINLNANVSYRLPERKEGYGISKIEVNECINDNIDLVITCDTGVSQIESIKELQNNNIEVIVTDHHEPQKELPNCLILDPKVNKSDPFDSYCGAGIAFKLMEAIYLSYNDKLENQEFYNELLESTCVATISDAVPLIDENRTIVKKGLYSLNYNKANLGIKTLLNEKKITDIDSDTIGFFIGPCLNASGRLESPNISLDLLLSDDEVIASELSKKLIFINEKRKILQKEITDNIEINEKNKVIIAIIDKSYIGIAGIVANNIVNKYQKPCFVFSDTDVVLKGSGRSSKGFNLMNCIINHQDILEGGGGHNFACGVAIKKDNIDKFQEICNEEFNNYINTITDKDLEIYTTCEIDTTLINNNLIDAINQLQPFGAGNLQPIFLSRNTTVDNIKIVGKNKNVLQCKINGVKAVAFQNVFDKFCDLDIKDTNIIDIIYTISKNEYPENIFNPQIMIQDVYINTLLNFDESQLPF